MLPPIKQPRNKGYNSMVTCTRSPGTLNVRLTPPYSPGGKGNCLLERVTNEVSGQIISNQTDNLVGGKCWRGNARWEKMLDERKCWMNWKTCQPLH